PARQAWGRGRAPPERQPGRADRASVVGWHLVVGFGADLCLQFLLTLRQCIDQQLQPFDVSLLAHQLIIQRLQGVVLESQAALQLGNAFFYVGHASPSSKRKSSVSTRPSLALMPCTSSLV